ncbi:NAD-dependent epimerase/dehydratase family protein [Paenibacillus sanguinis]|uniref:NAD-dependent epimerase/dehydratase family protein n=1 Tax=Paenibacillus sanguinis TaxID=225906 RepID=UPI00037E806D|nr:NAD-dependent epimerase/dehydratase family protein [Paenibacillus sanguinis]
MAKILVFGGSRYFGKRLVNLLIQQGRHDITVITRGQAELQLEGPVRHLRVDRTDESALQAAVGSETWDIIYDNICFLPREALSAIRIFKGKVKRYILTSTLSVYNLGKVPLTETDFDPYRYGFNTDSQLTLDYGEGKRQVEAAFFQYADFPVAAMRIPIVLGPDDYTQRLQFHIDRVRQGTPIGLPNPEAAISFIHSAEAANFLNWLRDSAITGPINACSIGEITIRQLLGLIEEATGKQAIIQEETAQANQSPFGISSSWIMDHTKAMEAGYRFEALDDWLPDLVRAIAAKQ